MGAAILQFNGNHHSGRRWAAAAAAAGKTIPNLLEWRPWQEHGHYLVGCRVDLSEKIACQGDARLQGGFRVGAPASPAAVWMMERTLDRKEQ